jgi:hypothetical protein
MVVKSVCKWVLMGTFTQYTTKTTRRAAQKMNNYYMHNKKMSIRGENPHRLKLAN